jgi:hypothetical protein
MITIEHQDGIFASKQHVTLRILHYRENLAHLSTIVVSVESSEKWMPKLSIRCKGCAGTADKKGEADELDHLRKQIGSIRIELVGPALHQRPFSSSDRLSP